MLHTAEIDMAISVEPSDIDAFQTNTAWAICSTYHTFLKAFPGAAILVGTCCSKYPSLLTGTKLENVGSVKQTKTWNGKITHDVIGTMQLVIRYFLGKMVSSAKVKKSGLN